MAKKYNTKKWWSKSAIITHNMNEQKFENGYLEFENVTEALKYFSNKILDKPIVKSMNEKNKETYKKEIIEIPNQFFCITNPKKVIFNLKNYRCLPYWTISEIISECLNINPPIMNNYRKDIIEFSYDLLEDGRCEYLYGGRWNEFNLLEQTYKLLKRNPTSKRAIIPIFTPYDVSESRNDVPCNTMYNFLLRDNKLNMTVIVRSWDILRGFRYDFSLYSFILQALASWLKVDIGNLFISVTSLHCYGDKIQDLKSIKLNLAYERETLELDLDKKMEIGKFYNDLRLLAEIEVLSRNKDFAKVSEKLLLLNYEFARDFARVYMLKNNAWNMQEIDNIIKSMETPIQSWYEDKKS